MSVTAELPRYRCHKEVWALKIKAVIPNPRGYELHFENERYAPHEVSTEWVGKCMEGVPKDRPDGYFVVYADGYQSYSPAKAFEEGYRLIGPKVVTDDAGAQARMEAALWEFIDTAGAHPQVRPDPRVWPHVQVYMPKPGADVRDGCPPQVCHDEDLLEQLFWEFDAERKSGEERLRFKGFMRAYAQRMYLKQIAKT